jgi:hypothetical protein
MDAGAVVRSWPMRGTLHLVAAEDLGWLLELLGPRVLAGAALRQQRLGLTEQDTERARAAAVAALGRVGWIPKPDATPLWLSDEQGRLCVLKTGLAADFGHEPALFEAAEPLELRGGAARVLSPGDELLAACVAGARATPYPPAAPPRRRRPRAQASRSRGGERGPTCRCVPSRAGIFQSPCSFPGWPA